MVFALGSRSETLRSGGELAPYRHSCCLALVPRLGISSPSTEPYQEKPLSVTHAHRKLTPAAGTGRSAARQQTAGGPAFTRRTSSESETAGPEGGPPIRSTSLPADSFAHR